MDLKGLGSLPHVTPLRLDVTSPQEVQQAVELVRRRTGDLHGLVNNAGVNGFGPLLELSAEALQKTYDVNFYGLHRMAKAFAPLLIASKGRIVNISSVNGFLATKFFGAYNISKHAVEAYSDTLRDEVAPFGVRVSTVEPGDFRSEFDANYFGSIKAEEVAGSRYSEELTEIVKSVQGSAEMLHRNVYPPPDKVAEAVFDALFSPNPRPRYLVGNRDEAIEVIEQILKNLAQLNSGPENRLTKEQLVEILERHLG